MESGEWNTAAAQVPGYLLLNLPPLHPQAAAPLPQPSARTTASIASSCTLDLRQANTLSSASMMWSAYCLPFRGGNKQGRGMRSACWFGLHLCDTVWGTGQKQQATKYSAQALWPMLQGGTTPMLQASGLPPATTPGQWPSHLQHACLGAVAV